MFEYSLFKRARAAGKHIVLPEGDDDRILRAAEILRLRDVVQLTVLGEEERIRDRAATLGLRLEGVRIIDPRTAEQRLEFAETLYRLREHKGITREMARDTMTDVSYFGTMMVYNNMADGMVSGALHTTAHTIRPAFQFIRTPPDVLLVSSVFLMCMDTRIWSMATARSIPIRALMNLPRSPSAQRKPLSSSGLIRLSPCSPIPAANPGPEPMWTRSGRRQRLSENADPISWWTGRSSMTQLLTR